MKMNLPKHIHPLLLIAVRRRRKHELHILNDRPNISGNAIYAVNHSCRYDIPYALELIRRHSYVLVGKQRLNFMERIVLFLNGVVYVDRKNRRSKTRAKQQLKTLLRHGHNVCMFPEATWNLTPSKPMLPLYWGIIEIARETKCPIIPGRFFRWYQGQKWMFSNGRMKKDEGWRNIRI